MNLRIPLTLTAVLLVGGALLLRARPSRPVQTPQAAAGALEQMASRPPEAGPLVEALRSDLSLHRQLALLFAQEGAITGSAREEALTQGHLLHHQRRTLVFRLDAALAALGQEPAARREPVAAAVLDWLEKDPEVLELDRLAFRDPLRVLGKALAGDASAEGMALKARVARDLAEVDRVEALAEAEYRQVYGGPGVPPKGGERQRWKAYLDAIRGRVPKAGPVAVPQAPSLPPATGAFKEINGHELPDHVLVLTFDDGPHRVYTQEIQAILMRGNAPAVFFEVGRNLGAVDASGTVKLSGLSNLTEDLVKAGFRVGNHSYTHAQLSKETGAPLEVEIGETDRLLQAIPGAHTQLFRFPYGARTATQLQALEPHRLRSVLWNIDSLDWADPVPASVEDRVIKGVEEEKRGIILFHDIHDRAGKVLPSLLEKLRAKGYRFAGLDGEGNVVLP
jgi:peptidoglycan/xylan/chitin deacetylase (PgdA/CDA1 family)